MEPSCPDCGSKLHERAPNLAKNIKQRTVDSRHHRFVCRNCKATFSKEKILMATEANRVMEEWMEALEGING